MSDRALQDRVIQYLTDATAREAGPVSLPLSDVEAARAGRFANFLARHYYRDRLARSFQYSHVFRGQTGRSAEQIADSAEFDAFLPTCVLGSLDSAQRVGDIARQHMLATAPPARWWSTLIEYEYAYFLQAATSEFIAPSHLPARSRSAVIKHFEWFMPEVLTRIRRFPLPVTSDEIDPSALQRPTTLLFSRNREGKLFVVEVENALAAVFDAVDSRRNVDEIASFAGVPADSARAVISALANIGALEVSPSH